MTGAKLLAFCVDVQQKHLRSGQNNRKKNKQNSSSDVG
jgi:hypothetical protein